VEIYEANENMYAHQYEGSLQYCVFDFTDAKSVVIDTTTIQRIAERDKLHLANRPEMIVAIVAPDPHVFGLARMWQAYVQGAHLQTLVLRSRDSAMEYLRDHGIEA
jgi:hypothetical protein